MPCMGRGTVRRTVEGNCATIEQIDNHRVRAAQDLHRRHSNRHDVLFLKPSVPSCVALRPIAKFMCHAIYFDRDAGSGRVEIEHIGPDRMLATKLYTARPCSKPLP